MASDSEANCEFLRFLCRLLVFGRWRLFSCCEGDRLHFNLFLFAILCCCRRKTNDRTKGRTNGNIASGQQKMASHIAARFLSFLLSFFFLAPSLSLCSRRVGKDWRRARSQSCDANDSLGCLSDDRLVFHSYTTGRMGWMAHRKWK